jgi:ABC-2 type transport system ATP-binding protein
MSAAIQVTDLGKRFRKVPVVDGLNFQVPEGSVFGLIGPNGAGKTTTIKILMNILKPSAGRAEILGVGSRRLGPDDFTQIGYVSENQEMPDWMTVQYLLRYLKPFYPAWDDRRAAELVDQFHLPLGRKLRDLSRGMWMKTALASSLAYRPRLLVLDEPFTGLDPLVREELTEGLVESAGETTILLSSHDLADIENFVSHVAYLDHGRLQFAEEMSSLSARFRLVEVTLDGPAELPSNGQWPANWLRPEAGAALVRFVETHFDAERTPGEVQRRFGGVREIAVNPMPLRSIFLTLARDGAQVK